MTKGRRAKPRCPRPRERGSPNSCRPGNAKRLLWEGRGGSVKAGRASGEMGLPQQREGGPEPGAGGVRLGVPLPPWPKVGAWGGGYDSAPAGDLALMLFPSLAAQGSLFFSGGCSFHELTLFPLSKDYFSIGKIPSVIWLRLSNLCLSYLFKSQCQHHHHCKVFTQQCTATNNSIYGNIFSFLYFFLFFDSVTRGALSKRFFLQVRCMLFVPRNLPDA